MDAISVKEILTTVVLVAIIMLIYYMSYSEKRGSLYPHTFCDSLHQKRQSALFRPLCNQFHGRQSDTASYIGRSRFFMRESAYRCLSFTGGAISAAFENLRGLLFHTGLQRSGNRNSGRKSKGRLSALPAHESERLSSGQKNNRRTLRFSC